MIIDKVLYGFRSSGKQFGDLLAEYLKNEGFIPPRAEPQIFLRQRGNLWEFIATYMDNLLIVSKHPSELLDVQ